MKNLFLISILSLTHFNVFSQWMEAGNNIGPPTFNTFFGTQNGFEIRTITNGQIRGYMNPNRTTAINGFPGIVTDGFYGLGPNSGVMFSTPPSHVWDDLGPFYRLHINSDVNPTGVQELGYRPWMRNGIGLTGNSDNFFISQRANSADVTDNIIGWSDNSGTASGPDNLLFTFTSHDASTIGIVNGDLTGQAMNGREIMRLTAIGNIGMGPRFNNANQPQSQLHINTENSVPAWLQISNQNTLGAAYFPLSIL
jgi:hypothetical protein